MKSLEEIVVLAANTEKTPELVDFWLFKYQETFIKNHDFFLHERTIQAISSPFLSEPFSPAGEINIHKHFDFQTLSFNVAALQEIIFTSIRFLDAVLDIIPFDEQSKKEVEKVRKIGLGIKNLSEFEEKIHQDFQEKENTILNNLGAILSDFSYRASEALAEEKGECANWNDIKYNIENKSFTRWFTENNDIFDGEYIFQNYTKDSVKLANVQQIARRNSNLIVLNNRNIWQKWRDRTVDLEKIEKKEVDEKIKKSYLQVSREKNGIFKLVKNGEILELQNGELAKAEENKGQILNDVQVLQELNKRLKITINLYVFHKENICTDKNGQIPSFNLAANETIYSKTIQTLSSIYNNYINILQIKINTVLPDHTGVIVGCHVQLNKETPPPFKQKISEIVKRSELDHKLLKPILNDIQKHQKMEEKLEKMEREITELQKEREVNNIIIKNAQKWNNFDEITLAKKYILKNGSQLKIEQMLAGNVLKNLGLKINEGDENLKGMVELLQISLNNELKNGEINLKKYRSMLTNSSSVLKEILDLLEKNM